METFGLDRGWGVFMVGSVMIHDGTGVPRVQTIRLDQSPGWPGVRSEDDWLCREFLKLLQPAHVWYAHNGDNFDVRWLRSISLKYDIPWVEQKLIDPAKIGWKKYAIGRNSLSALCDFLGIPEEKIHVAPDVWRRALLDDDKSSWDFLQERCESDVRILNAVAGRVTRDVGMVDYRGSAYR